MKRYVKSFPERVGYSDSIKSKYDDRLWLYATKALKDLTLIAEKLPEDLQRDIFNKTHLEPFFRAIFSLTMHWDKMEKAQKGFSKITYKGKRMLNVCNLALSEIGQRRNAALLAINSWPIIKQLPSSTHDAIYGTNAIQAIQIEGYLSKNIEANVVDML